jgi:dTDP-N-acetylfucosamine:lipid II N-acetylfucosaminyltransferase
MPWNYGSLEESLVKNFIGGRVSGNSILLGNSASFTNNHIEAFELIKKVAAYEIRTLKLLHL